ncbi:hypothetical protein, partial [Brachyspira hyodysenteriae]|uniref:hypothetical protein n=1 Tax=Brachyspira hyodysenteriae TaxID=159 RepID=UPI00063D991A
SLSRSVSEFIDDISFSPAEGTHSVGKRSVDVTKYAEWWVKPPQTIKLKLAKYSCLGIYLYNLHNIILKKY